MEYINVTESEFDDILDVLQERGLDPRYSIEDSEDGGAEYHIHNYLEEVGDILWGIGALAVVEIDIFMPETCENMAISGAVMP